MALEPIVVTPVCGSRYTGTASWMLVLLSACGESDRCASVLAPHRTSPHCTKTHSAVGFCKLTADGGTIWGECTAGAIS
jgi:hypothetical protein